MLCAGAAVMRTKSIIDHGERCLYHKAPYPAPLDGTPPTRLPQLSQIEPSSCPGRNTYRMRAHVARASKPVIARTRGLYGASVTCNNKLVERAQTRDLNSVANG
ncbi:hypothetical protein EVAR_8374_1 [Eumeta japonica]|uniref:Uncharacterized protein n=1 Tax=Eumeta variegata TaxID=151549 RepID=A0A4C1VD54_EUMVA|nr:hypothetical protein EVAR_8374_1 [Eumeta japonica]